MKVFYGSLVLFFSLAFFIEKKEIRIFMAGDSTMSIKDTRAYPETGWGMPFVHFWDSTVTVVNRAKNGRSTKTFISEGLWKSITDEIRTGDYVFIQFGHNDEAREKAERYTTPAEFKANLVRFINETKLKGAVPVLLTPVSRRRFDSTGTIQQTHEVYSKLVREAATENNTVLIDLDEKSRELLQKFGKNDSRLLFLQLKAGEHPNYPQGKDDNTHFNELGARLVAQLVLEDVRKFIPDLKERVIKPVIK